MRTIHQLYALLLGFSVALTATAQQDFSKVEIKTQKVAEGIYMLQGAGGNIGVSVGDDGVFVIDDQYAPLAEKIRTAISALSDKPVKFVINTHWHGDHTGGNEAMGKGGAIIVAHANVRKRLQSENFIKAFNMRSKPAPAAALPVVTFEQGVTFHWNNQTLEVRHPPAAHTDGDAVILFKEANVIHTGDLFFNGIFPFIDASTGGSIAGMISGADMLLAASNADTRFIPGHGPLGDRAELQAYRDMLATAYARLKALRDEGKSDDEIIAAKPLADLDAEWGDGFLKMDMWVGIVLEGMAK